MPRQKRPGKEQDEQKTGIWPVSLNVGEHAKPFQHMELKETETKTNSSEKYQQTTLRDACSGGRESELEQEKRRNETP